MSSPACVDQSEVVYIAAYGISVMVDREYGFSPQKCNAIQEYLQKKLQGCLGGGEQERASFKRICKTATIAANVDRRRLYGIGDAKENIHNRLVDLSSGKETLIAAVKAIRHGKKTVEGRLDDLALDGASCGRQPAVEAGEAACESPRRSCIPIPTHRPETASKSPRQAACKSPRQAPRGASPQVPREARKASHEVPREAAFSYGYLQIDDYARKQKRGGKGNKPYWVALPKGIEVHSYPRSCDKAVVAARPRKLRSCLRQVARPRKDVEEMFPSPRSTASENSDSTSASSSDNRHVHFCDGLRAGEAHDSLKTNMRHYDQWVYIDRDICGFSLHEYAPHDPSFKDFASSDFGRLFCAELSILQRACSVAAE